MRVAPIIAFVSTSVGISHRESIKQSVQPNFSRGSIEMATTYDNLDEADYHPPPEPSALNKLGNAVTGILGINTHNNNDGSLDAFAESTMEIDSNGRKIFQRPSKVDSDPQYNDNNANYDNSGQLNALILAELQNNHRSAAGLNTLIYHPDLEANIKSYIVNGPSCAAALQHSRVSTRCNISGFLRLGENLWKGYWNPPPTNKDVVDDWYNEKYCFNYGPVGRSCSLQCSSTCQQKSPRAGCQTGHFTQMMWAGLTHIGCAAYTCPSGATIAGCVYGKEGGAGGNYMGVLPFEAETAGELGLSTSTCSAGQYYTFVETGTDVHMNKGGAELHGKVVKEDVAAPSKVALQGYFGAAMPETHISARPGREINEMSINQPSTAGAQPRYV